jgi:hypothetical protein
LSWREQAFVRPWPSTRVMNIGCLRGRCLELTARALFRSVARMLLQMSGQSAAQWPPSFWCQDAQNNLWRRGVSYLLVIWLALSSCRRFGQIS